MQTPLILLIATLAVSAWAQNCVNQFQSLGQCVKNELQTRNEGGALESQIKREINQCFNNAGCDIPDYDAQPSSSFQGGSLTDEQKQCMKDKMKAKMESKIRECLGDSDFNKIKDLKDLMKPQNVNKEQMKARLNQMRNVYKAKEACESQSGSNSDRLESCLKDVKRRHGKCAAKRACGDRVSSECKDEARELKEKVCDCIDEVKEEMEARKQQAQQNNNGGGFLGGLLGGRRNGGGFGGLFGGGNNQQNNDDNPMTALSECGICSGITCLNKMQELKAQREEAEGEGGFGGFGGRGKGGKCDADEEDECE